MISYESYKALHIMFIISFFMSIAIMSYDPKLFTSLKSKATVCLISFFIFVAGMGLIARLHFKHSEPFPLWVRLKIINWIIINALVISIFKVESKKLRYFLTILTLCCAFLGIWLAINKL